MKLSKVEITSENKETYQGNNELRKMEFDTESGIKNIEITFCPPGYYSAYSYTIHYINNKLIKNKPYIVFDEKKNYWVFKIEPDYYTQIDPRGNQSTEHYHTFLIENSLMGIDFKQFIRNFAQIDEAFQEDRPKFL